MKKTKLMIKALLLGGMVVSTPVKAGVYNPSKEINFKGLYFATCQVQETKGNMIYFQDEVENVFQWGSGVKHTFHKGEVVTVLFHGNGTVKPNDDKIVCVTYRTKKGVATTPIKMEGRTC